MSVNGTGRRGFVLAASNASSMVSASGNTASGWVQLIAATTTPILITSVFTYLLTNTSYGTTVSLATGAAASEVTIFQCVGGANSAATVVFPLTQPIRIPSGTRVAMKYDTVQAAYVGITYVNESSVI